MSAVTSAAPKRVKADWVPRERDWLSTHFLSIPFSFIPGLQPFVRYFSSVRWIVAYPLQRPFFGSQYTHGEVLALFPYAFYLALTGVVGLKHADIELSGKLAGIFTALTIVSASHNSLFTFVLGIPFERAMFYHKLAGFCSVLSGLSHGYAAYDNWLADRAQGPSDKSSSVLAFAFWSPGGSLSQNASGSIFVALMIGLVVTSLYPIRRLLFELFYALHVSLVCGVVAMTVLHDSTVSTIASFAWIADVVFRYVYLAGWKYTSSGTITAIEGGIVTLSFDKETSFRSFDYKAGQYVFIMVPKLGVFQWHPFSISSSPHDPTVTLHIKALGGWTSGLHALATSTPSHLTFYMEGPLGSPSIDINSNRYQCVATFSGGIGVTPMLSIANDVLHQESRGRPLKKLLFVWSVRDGSMIEAMRASSNVPGSAPSGRGAEVQLVEFKKRGDLENGGGKALGGGPTSLFDDDTGSLHTELYVTKGAVQNLPGVKSGRPDMRKLLEEMRSFAISNGETRVGVLCCGPTVMIEECRKLCGSMSAENHSEGNVAFDCHSEVFEL